LHTFDEVNKHNMVVHMSMHPHGPARYFFWPSREDLCYVPYTHILLSIGMPYTSSGRQHRISEKDFKKIQSMFSDINN